MANNGSLLNEIERDLLDGAPAADVLRKLIVLGGRAGSSELRDWASQELRGYRGDADLPDYRKVPAAIQMDAVVGRGQITGQMVAPEQLPEFVRKEITNEVSFHQGIGEIQAIISSGVSSKNMVHFALPGSQIVAGMIDKASGNPYQHVTNIYWSVSTAALEGLVDQVKTRLAELLGELRAATPAAEEVPTAVQAANAVNVVVHGRGNRVQVAHGQEGNISSTDVRTGDNVADRPFWTVSKAVWSAVVGLATIAGAVVAWWGLAHSGG